MKAYTFALAIYDYDLQDKIVVPAYEQGVYMSYEKAYEHLKEITKKIMGETPHVFYEDGYSETEYPYTDIALLDAENDCDWELFDTLMYSHITTDIDAICEQLINATPPLYYYSLIEIDIID